MYTLIQAVNKVIEVSIGLMLMLAVGWVLVSFFVRVFRGERLVITDQDRRFVRNGLGAIAAGATVAYICSALSSRAEPVNSRRFRIGDD